MMATRFRNVFHVLIRHVLTFSLSLLHSLALEPPASHNKPLIRLAVRYYSIACPAAVTSLRVFLQAEE